MGKEKKHKKDKKHKKHKKEKRRHSSSDSSDSEDWVEKVPSSEQKISPPEKRVVVEEKEDVWGSVFTGKSTMEIRKEKEASKVAVKQSLVVQPGQSSRELNPYWKNGGTGLPPERGDVSVSERERDDSRSSSRGMFQKPRDSDDQDDSRSKFRRPHGDYSNSSRDRGSSRTFQKPGDDEYSSSSRDRGNTRTFQKPGDDEYSSSRRDRGNSRTFQKPGDDEYSSSSRSFRKPSDSEDRHSADKRSYRSSEPSRGWRKPDSSSERRRERSPLETSRQAKESKVPSPDRDVEMVEPVAPKEVKPDDFEPKLLTSDEKNQLNAKIMRAEISGKTELIAKLKNRLERCMQLERNSNTVILTETDSKGFTRPVPKEPQTQGTKKSKKVKTHEDSKRVRYFADDDDFSLQDMYEKEKYSSARDQEESFMNLMGKEMMRKDGSLALDDPFEETASIDNRNKKDKNQWDRSVREQAKKEKIYDECKWCLGAKRMNQKLIIKSKQKVYLSCPPFQSLTEGHCLILPHSHVSCSVLADEDIWEEVMELRKELVRKFEKNDEDLVFFEHASNLHKHPHMIIQCVPLPREVGDTAPIYFKKALLECEAEWSNNKKVVELAGRGLRKSVPKGLPYFAVDFGNQDGYAHVIEDQQLFPRNFAQEIVGGMLDLDHLLWRKQRNLSEEDLNKNLTYLKDFMKDDD